MKVSEIILEFQLPKNKWELLVSAADKHEFSGELVDLVKQAYAKTPMGSFVQSMHDVVPSDWLVIDWDPQPGVDAAVFYRGPRGNERWTGFKIQGLGHDGQQTSKAKATQKVSEYLNKPGWWIESSDAMRRVLSKSGAQPVTDVNTLRRLFNDNSLTMIDEITYTRTIPSGTITETVFGRPIVR